MPSLLRLPAGLLLALSAACAASPRAPASASDVAPPRPAPALAGTTVRSEGLDPEARRASLVPEGGTPAGWVDGRALSLEEILVEWQRTAPREVFLIVEKLVSARLAFAEAERLGLKLDEQAVEAACAAQIARTRAEIAREAGGEDLDDYIREVLGTEPERQWETVRAGVRRQMLAERAVRAFALEHENARVRILVVADEAQARGLADELAAGADFATLAREHSIDSSAAEGGLVPYLVRQDAAPLARIVFAAAPGELVGPLPAAGHFFLVLVEELRAPLAGGPDELLGAVEQSLRAFPVAEAEFLHWKLEMEQRYPVDLGPLLRCIGAPTAAAQPGRDP
jgi:hypothetical protein